MKGMGGILGDDMGFGKIMQVYLCFFIEVRVISINY